MISNQNANIKNPFEKRDEDPNKRSILSLVKNTELITIDFKVVGNKVIKSYWSDSILNYFSSENFNIHQLVYYLGHRQEKGITDFLMNLMSEKLINQSFYYLPQLIILLSSKKYSKPIETFLLDRCIGQMKFSIIINWLVTACAEDMKIRGLTNKKYEKFQNRIEMTLVNGKRSTLSSYSLYNLKRRDTQYQILKGSLDKEQRLNYYNQVIIFYTTLKSLCMKLKEYPRETVQGQEKLNRNYVLRDNLKRYNDNIENLYEKTFGPEPEIKNDLNDFFRGILLPLNDSEFVDDEYNNIIVRIKPEYCMCFSTKARVPVKLVVECVRVGECKNWASLYIQEKKEDKKEENAEEEVDIVKGRSKTKNDPKNKNEDNNRLNTGCVTNNYGSLDEFFTKLDLEDREAKEKERKEREKKNIEEINKILNDVKFANEHPEMEKNFTFSQSFGYSQSGRSSNLSKQRNTVSYMTPNPEESKEEFLCEDTALEDRRNFNDFNPYVYPNSNRAGEDFVSNPPTMLQSEFVYPGYPYEKNYISNDLHMLASSREGAYDPRFDEDHRLDRGIPGLTDGANAVKKEYGKGETLTITNVLSAEDETGALEMMIRLPETNLESAKVKIGEEKAVSVVANAEIGEFTITYADLHKGLFAIKQTKAGDGTTKAVNVSYVKRGMAGVPTYMDWDGCQGMVSVLLQK